MTWNDIITLISTIGGIAGAFILGGGIALLGAWALMRDDEINAEED